MIWASGGKDGSPSPSTAPYRTAQGSRRARAEHDLTAAKGVEESGPGIHRVRCWGESGLGFVNRRPGRVGWLAGPSSCTERRGGEKVRDRGWWMDGEIRDGRGGDVVLVLVLCSALLCSPAHPGQWPRDVARQ